MSLQADGMNTNLQADEINTSLQADGTSITLTDETNKNLADEMTIKEAQLAVDRWIKEYGVRYFSELTNMAVLTEEVGELARIMARRYGEQSWKKSDPRASDNGREALGDEMADVLWVLMCIANQTGVDLEKELRKSIDKKTKRDKDRHINNEKLK